MSAEKERESRAGWLLTLGLAGLRERIISGCVFFVFFIKKKKKLFPPIYGNYSTNLFIFFVTHYPRFPLFAFAVRLLTPSSNSSVVSPRKHGTRSLFMLSQ